MAGKLLTGKTAGEFCAEHYKNSINMNPNEITNMWQRIIALENTLKEWTTTTKNHADKILALAQEDSAIHNKLKEFFADNIAIEKKLDDLKKQFIGHDHPHVHPQPGLLKKIWPR